MKYYQESLIKQITKEGDLVSYQLDTKTKKMNEIKSCAFTGHRPNKLYGYDLNTKECELLSQELIKVIKVLIEEKGVTRFISGGALGFDTIAYICVDFLKKQYKDIKNILAIPFENQYVKWNTMDKERYFKMKEFADEVIYVDTLENYKTVPAVELSKQI